MKTKLKDLQRQGEIILKERGIENYRNDVFCLLNKHFGASRADILLQGEQEFEEETVLAYMHDLQKRGDRVPLQHLLGSWEFMGLPFIVSPDVLIPRSETEWLVEYVLKNYADRPIKVLDLCTGSGCIGIAVKKLLPQAEVTLVDISALALEVAKQNAEQNEVEVTIEKWDILQGIPFFLEKERYDVLLSNPPYIKSEDLKDLQPEVQKEPALALDGGADGLLYYHALAKTWSGLLKEEGELIVEAGEDTAENVQKIFGEHLKDATLHYDLANLPRYVTATK
ncbi:MAG: peptide chain release factor N(5)-glutamine methyltransferase [Clostridia bacterium]|nr:peptide chain release factor N(5)-glutamine methyltransferase [Clostridia bacterium]